MQAFSSARQLLFIIKKKQEAKVYSIHDTAIMRTIFHIVKKEFLQFKRDPKMFGIILIAPIIQLVFLGYAATLDLNTVHTIFYDQDKTTTSRNFIEEFTSSGFFQIDHYADNYKEVQTYVEKGKSLVAIVIPKDFEKKI